MKWYHQIYGSGIVTQADPYRPYYIVDADDYFSVCSALVKWLNTGKRPAWVATLRRSGPFAEHCAGDFGISISATGPLAFQDYAKKNLDNIKRAAPLRVQLIDRLFE